MNTLNCKEKKSWTIRIPNFPEEKRREVVNLANESRRSVGSYLGSLLDREIEKIQDK